MSSDDTADPSTSEEPVSLGKGRPTPKRKDRQVRHTGPVAPPPTNRKEAAKRRKEKRKADLHTRHTGGPTGETILPRDQGPVRAMIRDLVDGRRNLILFVIPVLVLYVAASIANNDTFLSIVLPIYLTALLLTAFDMIALRRVVKSKVAEHFPDDTDRGHVRYAILRAVSFRRMRVPRARVSPPPLFGKRG